MQRFGILALTSTALGFSIVSPLPTQARPVAAKKVASKVTKKEAAGKTQDSVIACDFPVIPVLARTPEAIQSTPAQGTPVQGTPAQTVLDPYENLRQSSNAQRVRSPREIYNDIDAVDGRIVEMQGEVSGTIAREGKRTVLLRMNEEMAVLEVGPELSDMSTLRTGAMVTLLARVSKKESGNDALLTIVASSTKVDPPQPAAGTPVVLDNSVMVVPPMTSRALPQPQELQNPARSVNRPAPARSAASVGASGTGALGTGGLGSDPSGSIEAQKPAYKALVRRYNRKITEAQVDEIATALLTAAYANKMDPRFLAAIIAVESDFDIYCLSSSGAMGLGQLMPFNVKEAGIRDPWNPTQNIHGTARLLRGHLNDYANRPDGTLLAVAAYNAGPGAVRRAGYKVPSGQQVQRYVWKVYYRYKEFAPDKFQ